MRHIIISIILWLSGLLAVSAAEPYCVVKTYGDREGMPASTGTRVIQDRHGYIWVATWNGLYRFDGYGFTPIRPAIDNDVRR